MAEPLVHAASRLVECCALVAIGYNLRQSGVLRSSDGETALKLVSNLTLPSVIVQALGHGPPLGASAASLLGVAAVCMGAQLAATWLYVMGRPPRERSVLAGAATGLSLRLFGYPAAEAFFGGGGAAAAGAAAGGGGGGGALAALQSVALVDLVNHFAVWVGSYLLFAGAGPAFPESFKHEDGGEYRGQWRGLRKEGLGVYTYASGARYEGEWRDNLKEGRGVYYFPKGGVYEGEWAGGSMNGLGVRTLSSGQVKAGRWRDGQLEAPLELWQVALAADGAAAVAAAARRVDVGGGRLVDAAHMLAAQPTLWALAAGLAVNLLRATLPPSLDLLTGVLAQANAPLALLAAGLTAPDPRPLLAAAAAAGTASQRHLLADVARLLGSRLLVPLAVGLALTAMVAVDGGRTAPTALLPLAVSMMALLAPVPPQAMVNARRFRLNESTAATITAASYLACMPLMLLAGVAATAAGLAAPPAAAAAAAVDARPLLSFTMAAVAAVGAAVGYVTQRAEHGGGGGLAAAAGAAAAGGGGAGRTEDRRIRMVYAGPVEDQGRPLASASGEAGATSSLSSSSSSLSSSSSSAAAAAAAEPSAGSPADAAGAEARGGGAGPAASGAGGGESGGSGGGGGGAAGSSGGGAREKRPPPPRAAADGLTAAAPPPPPPGMSCQRCAAAPLSRLWLGRRPVATACSSGSGGGGGGDQRSCVRSVSSTRRGTVPCAAGWRSGGPVDNGMTAPSPSPCARSPVTGTQAATAAAAAAVAAAAPPALVACPPAVAAATSPALRAVPPCAAAAGGGGPTGPRRRLQLPPPPPPARARPLGLFGSPLRAAVAAAAAAAAASRRTALPARCA